VLTFSDVEEKEKLPRAQAILPRGEHHTRVYNLSSDTVSCIVYIYKACLENQPGAILRAKV
jgi:hypothetical protein